MRLEQQAWLRNGQTELAEQVLGQLTLNMLGRNILQFFAQYMGSVVAALYVREEHGGLKRVATYGFSREQEQQEQAIYSDEGIVGQAAQLGRLIRLDDVPVGLLQGEFRPGRRHDPQRAGGADQR